MAGDAISEATASENVGAEKQKLFPTDIGMVVNDFLVEHFPTIVDLNFTAKVEEEFDVRIAFDHLDLEDFRSIKRIVAFIGMLGCSIPEP